MTDKGIAKVWRKVEVKSALSHEFTSQITKIGKSIISVLELMSICQVINQKYGTGHCEPF